MVTGCAAMVMSALRSTWASIEIAEVHPVQMIAGEDQVVIGVVPGEVACGLANRVGRPLKPAGVVRRLLGREDLDEALAEEVHSIGLPDVAVERGRIELRHHEDAADVCVEAIADGDVDQPVLAADRHSRLGPVLRQRKQPLTLPAAENERDDFAIDWHGNKPIVHPMPAGWLFSRRG